LHYIDNTTPQSNTLSLHDALPILQVDELIEMKKNYDASFQKLLHHLQLPEEQTFSLPKNLRAELRSYQVTGFQWFKSSNLITARSEEHTSELQSRFAIVCRLLLEK